MNQCKSKKSQYNSRKVAIEFQKSRNTIPEKSQNYPSTEILFNHIYVVQISSEMHFKTNNDLDNIGKTYCMDPDPSPLRVGDSSPLRDGIDQNNIYYREKDRERKR